MNKPVSPLVSVITPTYNSSLHVTQVIYSVRAQTLNDYEHIIVDDCSIDGTAETVRELSLEDERIRLLCHDVNRGAAATRNTAIEAAVGQYIAFLDSDDDWEPEKLETQISFMRSRQIGFSYGAYRIAGNGTDQVYYPPEKLDYSDLLWRCPVGCLTAAYDQEACGKLYMPLVRRGQDWGLWLQLARKFGPAYRYPGVHATYHKQRGSVSSGKIRKIADMWSIYRDYEQLGLIASGAYCGAHILSSIAKNKGWH